MTQYPAPVKINESLCLAVRKAMAGRSFREVAKQIGIRPTTLCRAYHGKTPGIVGEAIKLEAWLPESY